ncbi:MAG: hydantoinase/oxoprolinase family protein, partial [Proteobacteria bacterium]|nr:hydantoinase/oxoprolinase family protein [Pseudomonadota bacterium]
MRVGIEVGGTFTDLVVVDADGVRTAKVPSTPARPDEGAMHAIEAAGLDPAAIEELVHGSTVATNAVLERKGAKVCLFVTRGTRDLLLLQRHDRGSIYDLHYRKPEPVVARRDTFEIDERLSADGAVISPLDEKAAEALVKKVLADGDYQAAAICFLHSYADPSHEQTLARIIRAVAPAMTVTCSSDVTREFR